MATKNTKKQKPYWEMTLEELREATKEYDKPIPMSKMRPLTKAEREKFERMQKSPYHSVFMKRNSSRRVAEVELDSELFHRSADYAEKHKLSLSQVIAQSLKKTLSVAK
jgi:hypothetical protein